jgi:ribosomal protein L18E
MISLPALNSLKNASKLLKQILEAVRMSKNEILKVNIAEITDHISKIINGLLVKLSP